jgi:hypothetical protein
MHLSVSTDWWNCPEWVYKASPIHSWPRLSTNYVPAFHPKVQKQFKAQMCGSQRIAKESDAR